MFSDKKWRVQEIIQCLEKARLMNAVKTPGPFDMQLVRELIANIPEEFGNSLDVNYGCVFVRGKHLIFSPRLFNEMLGIGMNASMPDIVDWDTVAQSLTGGKVRKWKGQAIESKFLTSKFALLHGICIRNWIPLAHRASINKQVAGLIFHVSEGKQPDLGQIIFDQLASHGSSSNQLMSIGHPSTIYQLMIKLVPDLADPKAKLTIPKQLVADWKVFSFGHHVDIAIPVSIQLALKRQGKIPKAESNSEKHSLHNPDLEQLKEQLSLLDKARDVTRALIARIEGVETDQESEGESDPFESD